MAPCYNNRRLVVPGFEDCSVTYLGTVCSFHRGHRRYRVPHARQAETRTIGPKGFKTPPRNLDTSHPAVRSSNSPDCCRNVCQHPSHVPKCTYFSTYEFNCSHEST